MSPVRLKLKTTELPSVSLPLEVAITEITDAIGRSSPIGA